MGAAAMQGWLAIRRHRRLFLGWATAIFVAGALVVAVLPESFRSSATVEIATQGIDPLAPVGEQQADPFQDDDLPSTVAAMMRSRDVAQAVLAEIPPVPPPPKPRMLQRICALTGNMICTAAPPSDPQIRNQAAIDDFLKNLAVTPESHSRILDVDVTASGAALAQALANAVVENYQRISVMQQAAQSDHAAGWLQSRTEGLQQQWLNAAQTANDYLSANNITDTNQNGVEVPLVDQQLTDAAASLEAAQGQLILAQAQHRAGSPRQAQPAEMTGANTQMLVQLESARDELAGEFGPNYPKVKTLNAQIATLRSAPVTQIGYGGPENASMQDVAAAQAQVNQLTMRLDTLTGLAAAQDAKQAQYAILQAEADNAHKAYSTFVEHAAEVADRTALAQPAITVVSEASLPLRPSFPDRPKLMLGTFFLALMAGTAAALAKDKFAEGFAEAGLGQAEGIPLLAALPYVTAKQGRQVTRHVLDEPYSRASDVMRRIAQSLSLLAVAQGRSVLVTSAGAREGRSIFSVWLASTISQVGGKALLIRTTQHDEPHDSAPVQRGFTDILFGNAKAEDVIQRDPVMEIDLISPGGVSARPLQRDDILRLRAVITQLKQAYSVVILDGPPLLAAQHGFALSEVADDTLFICRWQHSSASAVTASIDRLRAHGANVAGIVVSMMHKNVQPVAEERESRLKLTRLYGA